MYVLLLDRAYVYFSENRYLLGEGVDEKERRGEEMEKFQWGWG